MLNFKIGDYIHIDNGIYEIDGYITHMHEQCIITVIHNPWEIKIVDGFVYDGKGIDKFNLLSSALKVQKIDSPYTGPDEVEKILTLYEDTLSKIYALNSFLYHYPNDYSILEMSKEAIDCVIVYHQLYKVPAVTIDNAFANAIKHLSHKGTSIDDICDLLGITKADCEEGLNYA